ncbi:CoA-transferase family III [Atractiella rhizophila]|nr:CoA-transferase family III [Atractiella rhizophila]
MALPLKGMRVLEFAGLAPAPFAGMILADWGADVVRVDKLSGASTDVLCRGKRSLAVSLKDKQGIELIKKIIKEAPIDVIIEPFRPGVMERLGLGPEVLSALNPGLIYARMIGFDRGGKYEQLAGHDINYLAAGGVLSLIGPKGQPPVAPVNFLGDFAGGGLMCALGIILAHIEKQKSGKGQVVTADMVNGARYVSSFVLLGRMAGNPVLTQGGRGDNWLDGGAPWYRTYETKDQKYVSVGCIEPQFYQIFLTTLLSSTTLSPPPEAMHNQYDRSVWPALELFFKSVFLTKTRDEWDSIFHDKDACVIPVLADWEVPQMAPEVAPNLSRMEVRKVGQPDFLQPGTHTEEVLKELGWREEEVHGLRANGVISFGNEEESRAKL